MPDLQELIFQIDAILFLFQDIMWTNRTFCLTPHDKLHFLVTEVVAALEGNLKTFMWTEETFDINKKICFRFFNCHQSHHSTVYMASQ